MTHLTQRALARLFLMLLAAIAVALLASALWPARVAAEDKGATTLAMQPVTESASGGLVVSAKLTGPDGKPVGGAVLEFFFAVDFMGQTQASLGKAQTNASGTASVYYRLNQDGPVDFGAKFGGDAAFAAAASDLLRVEVTGAPAPAETQSRVRLVGRWVPWAALALAIGVWVVLIGVSARIVVAIPSASRGLLRESRGGVGEATQDWQIVSESGTN